MKWTGLSESAAASDSAVMPNQQFETWFAARRARSLFQVTRVPLTDLAGWTIDPVTGTLAHQSQRFFSVEGLRVQVGNDPDDTWAQPILVQREIGILGILVKRFDGIPHLLMQAKVEPGNTGAVRLSPTVQATRSNYTGVHNGRAIPYVDAFIRPPRQYVLVDGLQSERGAWFLRKRNRHMVVEAAGDVVDHEDFCWLTIGQVRALLRRDNVLSMEACSVLACLPAHAGEHRTLDGAPELHESGFRPALTRSLVVDPGDQEAVGRLIGRLCDVKARFEVGQRLIPLRDASPWRYVDGAVSRPDGRYFAVIGADVQAGNREVAHWTQPLIAPAPGGVVALLTRVVDGVLQLLFEARVEAGSLDVAEFRPTVQSTPANYPDVRRRPRFLDYVRMVASERIRYDAVVSEEGARFFHAQNRYLIVDVADDLDVEAPDDFVWMTAGQAGLLLRYGYYLNMQARTILAALHSLA